MEVEDWHSRVPRGKCSTLSALNADAEEITSKINADLFNLLFATLDESIFADELATIL